MTLNMTEQRSQQLSLFIPRVHNSMDEIAIERIFEQLNLGTIKRVDLVIPGMKHDPHKEIEEDIERPDPLPLFNICFIHYSEWNMENPMAVDFYRMIFESGKEVRVRYGDRGHFFRVFKNKNPKPDEQYELEQAFIKQQKLIQQLRLENQLLRDKLNGESVSEWDFTPVLDQYLMPPQNDVPLNADATEMSECAKATPPQKERPLPCWAHGPGAPMWQSYAYHRS